MSGSEDSADDTKTAKHRTVTVEIPKSTSDTQRIKINKLMSNIDKPVHIPSAPGERVLAPPPEFNRHVMGSTAGAGSGDFHTYRHLRRRTQAREEMSHRKACQEEVQEEFQKKLRTNYLESEAKTAKNRAKRQKQKARLQKRKETKKNDDKVTESDIQPEINSPVSESPHDSIQYSTDINNEEKIVI